MYSYIRRKQHITRPESLNTDLLYPDVKWRPGEVFVWLMGFVGEGAEHFDSPQIFNPPSVPFILNLGEPAHNQQGAVSTK